MILEQAKDWQLTPQALDRIEEVRTLEAKVHVCAKGKGLDRLRNSLHNAKFRYSMCVTVTLYEFMKTRVEHELMLMSV